MTAIVGENKVVRTKEVCVGFTKNGVTFKKSAEGGPVMLFTRSEWTAFEADFKKGMFDFPESLK